MAVRALGAADQPAWRALRLEAVERFPAAFLTTTDELLARNAAQDIAMLEHGAWRGMFDGDNMIGQALFLPLPYAAASHRIEIGGFYVTPDQHGAGVAQTLLDALVDEATSKGALQLELSVATDNPRAIRFYERNGFERFGKMPRAVFCDGKPQDDWFYVRFLDRPGALDAGSGHSTA